MRFQVSLVATGVVRVERQLYDASFHTSVEVSASSPEALKQLPVSFFAVLEPIWKPTSIDAPGVVIRDYAIRSLDTDSVKVEHIEPLLERPSTPPSVQ